jgi:hypothetical protein
MIQPTPSRRERGALALVLAGLLLLGGALPAIADPLEPRPTTGTATGEYRSGLAEEGLVELTDLGDARLWFALKNRADAGARFDVRVELLNNGSRVASGLRRCLRLDRQGSTAPREIGVPWAPVEASTVQPGDVLALRVSARVGTRPDGSSCGPRNNTAGVRVHFDAQNQPSRFTATISPDAEVTLHLRANGLGCSGERPPTLAEAAPTTARGNCQGTPRLRYTGGNPWTGLGRWRLPAQVEYSEALLPEVRNAPPAPAPEPITLERLPMPPIAPSNTAGSCDSTVNPNGTGCISNLGQLGEFIGQGHILGNVTFAGAPATGPSSIYSGSQLIVVKTDGTTFSNGDAWKCVTCGIPAGNRQGVSGGATEHPTPSNDGTRIFRGASVIDCGPHQLVDDACTPAVTHIYPIVWDTGATTGFVQKMRELRIHPDETHLGFNAFVNQPGGTITEFGAIGRLVFNPTPMTGVPRYDLTNVSWLINTEDPTLDERSVRVDPDDPSRLLLDTGYAHIGEFRGFTSDGTEALGIGTEDSCNWDPWATSLETGESRRLGRDPNYMDPMNSSPDDNWTFMADGRTDDRMAFLGALPGVPPVIDVVGCALQGIYNNGDRRFFEPILVDRWGERGSYHGQKVNDGFDETPGSGSLSDPLWNARADPRWSPDGTLLGYYETQVTAPACGGANPIVCPVSNEPGGLRTRWILARLTSRTPLPVTTVAPISDEVPWGTPYSPGDAIPVRPHLPAGTYTLEGKVFGSAEVVITENGDQTQIASIEVTYTNYSDDGINIVNGSHSRTSGGVYHENLTLSGANEGTRVTSEPTGWIFGGATRTGTLTTTINGVTYTSPPSNQ